METELRSISASRLNRYKKENCTKVLILLSAFFLNGQVFGHNYATSVLYSKLLALYPDQEMHISLIGSATFGLISFCGIFVIIFMKFMAERWIFLLGLSLFACGPIVSAFVEDIRIWYFTYTLPRGLGGSILYLLSYSTAAKAFPNNVCATSTIVSLGASVFSIIIPLMVQTLLEYCGLFYFLIIDGLYMIIFVLFTPIYKGNLGDNQIVEVIINEKLDQSVLSLTHTSCNNITTNQEKPASELNNENWLKVFREKKFILFLIISVVFLSFCNVPYVHSYNYLSNLSSASFHNPVYVTTVIGAGAIFNKSFSAFLVEYRKISSVILLQLALLMFGVGLTLFGLLAYLDSESHIYTAILYVGSLNIGFGEGSIWSLIYPVCYYCAQPYTDPAIFCIYSTIISFPCSLGAPFASFIYNYLGSYPIAFFIGGISYLLAANLFWVIDMVGGESYRIEVSYV